MPPLRTIRKPTRWTPDEWRQVEAEARARGVPPLRYVREAALGHPPATRRSRGADKRVRQLGRVLNNLRQLGRVAELDGDENPWEGFPIPTEDVPTRPEMTHDLHAQLVEKAPNWRMGVVLDLCRETRRRMNSVRQLALADIDLAAGTVRWQGEHDKVGKTRVTPLSTRARSAILRALELRRAEGLADTPWLLPAQSNAAEPVGKNTLHRWMERAKNRAGIKVPRLGYHAEKRAGIRGGLGSRSGAPAGAQPARRKPAVGGLIDELTVATAS